MISACVYEKVWAISDLVLEGELMLSQTCPGKKKLITNVQKSCKCK